jgi:hypothetical protein
MSEDKKIEVCPFCGKAWEKKEKAHHKYLDVVVKTALTLGTTTAMVLVLKLFGL